MHYYYHYLCIYGVPGICLGQDYIFHGRYNTGAMRIIYFHRHNMVVYNLIFDRGIGITLKLMLHTIEVLVFIGHRNFEERTSSHDDCDSYIIMMRAQRLGIV